VLIELFLLRVTAEAPRYERISVENRLFRSNGGHVDVVAPTNHSSSQKTMLYVLSCGIKIWRALFTVVTMHACDRQTDGQTDGRTEERTDRILIADRVCSPCRPGENYNDKTAVDTVMILVYFSVFIFTGVSWCCLVLLWRNEYVK